MKSGANTQGFTIVETLIFLGVSAVIMVSVLSLVGGSQNKAQFQQSVYDTSQQINDVIENVANGYYNNTGSIKCEPNLAKDAPSISTSTEDLGTNEGCIFIGRVLQFATAGKEDNMTVYDLVGLRQKDGDEVKTLGEANPKLIAKGTTNPYNNFPSTAETRILKGGLSAKSMKYQTMLGTEDTIGGLAIMSNLAKTGSGGGLESASQQISVYAIKMSQLMQNSNDFVDIANNPTYFDDLGSNGITLCMDSGSTDQSVIITIGSSNEPNRASTQIMDGTC